MKVFPDKNVDKICIICNRKKLFYNVQYVIFEIYN